MGSGCNCDLYPSLGACLPNIEPSYINGVDYNPNNSSKVGEVKTVKESSVHRIPDKGESNSVFRNYKKGKLNSERYYNENGEPYLEINYTDHGNSGEHPHVPHQHEITIENGRLTWGDDQEVK